ncbi:hypothetical protein BH20ACI2_BH20ACI2_10730 [soil metagenome]
MLVNELRRRLQFDNNPIETHEIRFEMLFKFRAFVGQLQNRLRDKWNALSLKFQCKTFLINSFGETATFFFIHLKTGTNDLVRFFLDK